MIEKGVLHLDQNEFVGEEEGRKEKIWKEEKEKRKKRERKEKEKEVRRIRK